MDPTRTPVIVAVGQAVEQGAPLSPLDVMERAATSAFTEAPGVDRAVTEVSVVNVLNGGGPAPATELAKRLRISPARAETTAIGGNTPQWLVTRAAARVAAGEHVVALVVGGEAVRSLRDAPDLAGGDGTAEGPDPVVGDDRPGLSGAELSVRLMLPAHVYPMFESVIAARSGRLLSEHRRRIGDYLAPFTKVAADHDYAWFKEVRSPAEIAEPSPDNRLVAEPYTKRMSAFLTVDQGAALVVTSLQTARDLGAAESVVYVHSGADANDVWFPVQRPDLGGSPGIRIATRAALAAAGCTADQLTLFDLYSCFPSAVEMAAEALGLPLDDERGLTVTGGLPYFGGPGNNYSTHAIATMVGRLRERGGRGLVTALGWFVTKHSVGVYGVAPPSEGFRLGDTSADQAAVDASALEVAEGLDEPGDATVEASTVVYDKAGEVSGAPVFATLHDGRRVAAAAHPDDLPHMKGVNLVGTRIRVEGSPPRYRVM